MTSTPKNHSRIFSPIDTDCISASRTPPVNISNSRSSVGRACAARNSLVNLPKKQHPSLGIEVLQILFLGGSILCLLSLFSYSPKDPSWSTFSSKQPIANWVGRMGSITADVLLQAFGGMAFFIPCFILFLILQKKLRGKEKFFFSEHSPFSILFFFVTLCIVLDFLFPQGVATLSISYGGGWVGSLCVKNMVFLFSELGCRIFVVILFLTASTLFFRKNLLSLFFLVLQKLFFKARFFLIQKKEEKSSCFISSSEANHTSLISEVSKIEQKTEEKKKWGKEEPKIEIAPHTPAQEKKKEEGQENKEEIPIVERSNLLWGTKEKEEKQEYETDQEFVHALTMQDKSISTYCGEGKEIAVKKQILPHQFELPSIHLLSGKAEANQKKIDKEWYWEKARILVETLKDFGVEGEVVNISPGPVIIVYEFKPASGVKIKEIANLCDDLTLALSVFSVRIVAPIPGKPVVGIEIPSPHREIVFFKDLIQETQFYDGTLRIPIVLGRLASGEPVVASLAQMPHLLVAGATGTGKSVFINSLICSLVYRYRPDQLKLILVDPKMVELSNYEGIPHLLLPVVVDSRKAVLALRWVVEEMESRYSLMHAAGVRHIDLYNDKVQVFTKERPEIGHRFLPYIVVVIDEYADLMAVVPKEVELSIARLAQKARAAGIHLVLATQRPSTDVVTGTIKANFPSRISFRVASSVDSKTILDRTGSDRLLGNGDLLFHSAGFTTLKRMQGSYVSDEDLGKIVSFLKAQAEPVYDDRILQMQQEGEEAGEETGRYSSSHSSSTGSSQEMLYDQVVTLVKERGEASISLIQRHLRIGYNRAASLMEELEKNDVVGPETGVGKRRAVLLSPSEMGISGAR